MSYLSKYQHVALGGTFDRLHTGHKELLKTAAKLSQKITIGLTTSVLYQHKQYAHSILSYQERKKELLVHMLENHHETAVNILPLNDPYGPTISSTDIQALVATPHTLSGAKSINSKRKQKGFTQIPIHLASLVTDDSGQYISSTRIRAGECSRDGHFYSKAITKDIIISQKHRSILKKPLGSIHKDIGFLKDTHKKSNIYAIGDVVSANVIKNKINYHHLVFDGFTKRRKTNICKANATIRVTNHKGSISQDASRTIQRLIHNAKQSHIAVSGEEDLLVIPYIMFATLESRVIYGQPDQGIVDIKVSEQAKNTALRIINEAQK